MIMRHYEIVLMVHPDRSEKISDMINHYRKIVNTSAGKIHRLENWGSQQLAYPVKKLRRAHYLLINLEVFQHVIDELENIFRFDDAIIRSMIIRVQFAMTEPSSVIKLQEQERNNSMVSKKNISSTHMNEI